MIPFPASARNSHSPGRDAAADGGGGGAGVSFDLVTPTAVWHLDGTLTGDSIDGTFQTAERQIRWTAVRKPVSTPSPTPRS